MPGARRKSVKQEETEAGRPFSMHKHLEMALHQALLTPVVQGTSTGCIDSSMSFVDPACLSPATGSQNVPLKLSLVLCLAISLMRVHE